ncbi:MAG: TetR/AcrR family transcriptional regulator [Gammaproteobacteria bacterium]|nr:TetR/AcrR family transcriptional regulator [Gammaproteobacteria bacterium]MDE0366790.1 TetR/AcrR family transcriptional regulator [Gammaproteobacteria bacterium]
MPKIVDHARRRQDFIEAACETILERSLEGTTVRAVAERAGYTTGALVHYFGDKEELIQQALNHFGDQVRAGMVDTKRTSRGRAALRLLMLQALPADRASAGRWRAWVAMWHRSETSADMRREERRRYREWLGRIGETLEESVEDGELPDSIRIEEEARAIAALVDGAGVQYLMAGARGSQKRVAGLVDRYLERLYGCTHKSGDSAERRLKGRRAPS